jgi:hypothetical protein
MKGLYFFVVAVAVAVIDVVVPFVLIGNVASFSASFLFWCLLTLIVIVAAGIYIRDWGKEE